MHYSRCSIAKWSNARHWNWSALLTGVNFPLIEDSCPCSSADPRAKMLGYLAWSTSRKFKTYGTFLFFSHAGRRLASGGFFVWCAHPAIRQPATKRLSSRWPTAKVFYADHVGEDFQYRWRFQLIDEGFRRPGHVALQRDGTGQMLSSTTEGRLGWVRYWNIHL